MKFLLPVSAAALSVPKCPRAPEEGVYACGKFQEFEAKYHKEYATPEERETRYLIFLENLAEVEYMNSHKDATPKSAKFTASGPYMDMPRKDFNDRNNLRVELFDATKHKDITITELKHMKDTTDFDWRDMNAVNPVKDQGQCGSCWSFATVANMEGVHAHLHGELLSLSEEELVSCDHNGDHGCNGGLPIQALAWMVQTGKGLEPEGVYPYHAKVENCEYKNSKAVVFAEDGGMVPRNNEYAMRQALMTFGPLAIGVNANPVMHYQGGILDPAKIPGGCDPRGINHAVTAVGFGEEDGVKYWTIRNSWSEHWGEKGYFRIVADVNACGLSDLVSTATATHGKSKMIYA